MNNIEDIVAVEGVDATFIGPSDLSASMGYRFIAVGSDTGFIRAGVNANLSQLKR